MNANTNNASLAQQSPTVTSIRPPINTTVLADNIPKALRDLPQWVNWKPVWDAKGEKYKKIPVQSDGTPTSVTDPKTWSTFDKVMAANREGLGVGFVTTLEDGIVGIDLDHARDPETGEAEPWAAEIIQAIDSYCEISPSGTGYRLFVYGAIPREYLNDGKHGTNGGGIEVYEAERYFTVTGAIT